jgi:cysteine synthase A
MMSSKRDGITESAIDLIGSTPLLALDRLWTGKGRILAKCEFLNPGASVKDRAALAMIDSAIESKQLKAGDSVVELTSGNLGSGLALVCAIRGLNLTLTMSEGNSPQRAVMMKALGANVVLVPQIDGKPGNVTKKDFEAVKQKAEEICQQFGAYNTNSMFNESQCLAHELTTGHEIWRQTGGRVDAFVSVVGSAGTYTGVSRFLKKMNEKVFCVAVEPLGSQVIKGESVTKPQHILQGSGYGFVMPLFTYETLDECIGVSDEEAIYYKKMLAHKEGVYCGYTSGANVAACVKLLKSGLIPEDSWVVTILCDSGLKYSEEVE